MKTIELRAAIETITVPNIYKDNIVLTNYTYDVVITTVSILRDIVNKPMSGGFNAEEMMQRLRLLGFIDKYKKGFDFSEYKFAKDIPEELLNKSELLELEDSDYNVLVKWVEENKWAFISTFIVDMLKDFNIIN